MKFSLGDDFSIEQGPFEEGSIFQSAKFSILHLVIFQYLVL